MCLCRVTTIVNWATANNIIDDNRNFIACAITHSFAIVLLNFIIYDLHLKICSTCTSTGIYVDASFALPNDANQ